MSRSVILTVTVLLSALCARARAEQFVLIDVSYTHSAASTQDSHSYPQLPANTPRDWTSPVDYAHGSVHIVLDVSTKPAGSAPTKFQICFEGSPSYACTLQSPTYTATGRVEWDSPFSGFWYDSTVDWSQGAKRAALILKDTMNGKPAGDPRYMPTDLHVQLTLVSAGSQYTQTAAAGSGGVGAVGAGGRAANASAGALGQAGAGAASQSGGGAGGMRVGTAGGAAGAAAGVIAAGSGGSSGTTSANHSVGAEPAGATAPSNPAGAGAVMAAIEHREAAPSGCSSVRSSESDCWVLSAALLFSLARRRHQRPRRTLTSAWFRGR